MVETSYAISCPFSTLRNHGGHMELYSWNLVHVQCSMLMVNVSIYKAFYPRPNTHAYLSSWQCPWCCWQLCWSWHWSTYDSDSCGDGNNVHGDADDDVKGFFLPWLLGCIVKFDGNVCQMFNQGKDSLWSWWCSPLKWVILPNLSMILLGCHLPEIGIIACFM